MNHTRIEWADATWNPIRGCTRVSEGCGPRWTGKVELIEGKLTEPLRWKKPRRVFVNSMSDMFHENVKEKWLHRIMAVIAAASQHTFMVLTKRARRMRCLIGGSCATAWQECILRTQEELKIKPEKPAWPMPNLWLGVSIENQQNVDRILDLMTTPAALRFVSCEPLLGPVDLSSWLPTLDIERESRGPNDRYLDWVIVGGESGPGARPMHPDWVRRLRYQCERAQTPFFFKQWGEWLPSGQLGADGDKPTAANTGAEWGILDRAGNYFSWTTAWNGRTGLLSNVNEMYVYRVGKADAGRLLDGRTWDERPYDDGKEKKG